MDERPFVGRDRELAALEDAYASASDGAPRVVFVVGGPGLGKTTLVDRSVASHAEAVILRADGIEDEMDIPYGLLVQLMRNERSAGAGRDRERPSSFAEAGAELVEMLGALQDRGPVILWVDDVHWADAPSVRALVFAFRRLSADRVLLILSLREEHEATMPDGLKRLAQRPEATRVTIGPLSLPDFEILCSELTSGRLTRRAVQRLHAHTGGSPLHLRALLLELDVDDLNGIHRELPAPRSFASLILARLTQCSPQTHALLSAASVLGITSDIVTAARLAEIDDPTGACDEAVQAGLLAASDARGHVVSFAHPLIRAAVYESLSTPQRVDLHRRATVVDTADVLRHRVAVARAVGGDDELHDDLQRSAVEHAMRGRWETGARYLFAASDLVNDDERKIARHLEAIDFLVLAGDGARATSYLEATSFPPTAFRFYVEGGARLLTGDLESAEALLRAAYERSDPLERNARAAGTCSRLSRLMLGRLQAEETLTWIARARDADFRPVWGGKLTTYELMSLGIAGRFDDALAVIARAPDGDLDTIAGRGIIRLWTGDVDGALADLGLVVATTTIATTPHHLLHLAQLAEAEYRSGRWDTASGHAEHAASLADDTDQLWVAGAVHGVAALVPSARGQWDVAEQHVRRARMVAAHVGSGLSSAWAEVAAIHLGWSRNAPEECLAAARTLMRMNVDGTNEPGVFSWRHMFIEALIVTGALEDASSALDEYEAIATERRCRSAVVNAGRCRGLLEAASGEAEPASVAFEEALERASDIALPFERACLETAYGGHLRRTGERRRASTVLSSALATFQSLGATPFEERCERERQACGLAPSRRKTVDVTKLTPQELSVARLVAEGMTNREVAAELVVSVKTIETHLGHVYAKLGVRSRTELASKLHAAG